MVQTEQSEIFQRVSSELEYRTCPLCNCDKYDVVIPRDHATNRDKVDVVECNNCDFIYTREIPKKLESIYTDRRGYDNIAERVLKKKKKRVAYRLNVILKYTRKVGRMLEVGCAYGNFIENAALQGWDAYAVDLTPSFINYLKKNGVNAQVGSIVDVKYKENFFDVVVLWDVLEHVRFPYDVLKAIHTVLNDKGLLCLRVPNVERYDVKDKGLINYLHRYFRPKKQATGDHINHFSFQTIKDCLNKTGFVDVVPSFSFECTDKKSYLMDLYHRLSLLSKRIVFAITARYRVGEIVIYCHKKATFNHFKK